MKLKAPPETTHAQTPARVYDLDDGYITIEKDSPDLNFFLNNGFTVDDTPANNAAILTAEESEAFLRHKKTFPQEEDHGIL